MLENEKKAFDFAADTTKQLITIATGIIALMVTFSKDVIGETKNSHITLLLWTWGLFIVSIIFGVVTLMALTGTLQPKTTATPANNQQTPASQPSAVNPVAIDINNRNIRVFSIIQALTFCVAIILTGLFGARSLSKENKLNQNTYPLIRHSTFNNDTAKKYTDTLYLSK